MFCIASHIFTLNDPMNSCPVWTVPISVSENLLHSKFEWSNFCFVYEIKNLKNALCVQDTVLMVVLIYIEVLKKFSQYFEYSWFLRLLFVKKILCNTLYVNYMTKCLSEMCIIYNCYNI